MGSALRAELLVRALVVHSALPAEEEGPSPWEEWVAAYKPVPLRLRPENTAIRWTRCRDRACRRHRHCVFPPAWCANPRTRRAPSPAQLAGASERLLARVEALVQRQEEERKAQQAAAQSKGRKQKYWPRPPT